MTAARRSLSRWNRTSLKLEQLETRLAPAAYRLNDFNVQYVDSAGVTFNVTATQPIFSDLSTTNAILTFVDPTTGLSQASFVDSTPFSTTPGTNAFLANIDLTGVGAAFPSISLSVVSTQVPTALTVVGNINSSTDLDRVVVRGRLWGINTNNSNVGALTVDYLGTGDYSNPQLLTNPDPTSASFGGISTRSSNEIQGNLGLLKVQHDVDNAYLQVDGNIGQVTILGNVGVDQTLNVAGYDTDTSPYGTSAIAAASMGIVSVRGSIFGGVNGRSGAIYTTAINGNPGGDITSVFVGGSIVAGPGVESGNVVAYGSIGKIQVVGSVGAVTAVSDIGNYSGSIRAGFDIINPQTSLPGFPGPGTGGNLNNVLIGGSVNGGLLGANGSGEIFAHGDILTAQIKGSLIGGTGHHSGRIHADGFLGSITVGLNVTGGASDDTDVHTGEISAFAEDPTSFSSDFPTTIDTNSYITKLTIGGALIGGGGGGSISGVVFSASTIGSLSIGGSIQGGSLDDGGQVNALSDIKIVSVKGSLLGGAGARSAAIISGGNIASATIGGTISGNGGSESGEIRAVTITSAKVNKDLIGGLGDFSGRIWASSAATTAQAITNNLNVDGVAGNDVGTPITVGVFSIGTLSIGGSLKGSGGSESGEVGTPGNIKTVTVGGDVRGGGSVSAQGNQSGRIVAGNDIITVSIGGSLLGGFGTESGEVVAGGNLGTSLNYAFYDQTAAEVAVVGVAGDIEIFNFTGGVTVKGGVTGGIGDDSGRIHAGSASNPGTAVDPSNSGGGITVPSGTIYSVSVGGDLSGYQFVNPGSGNGIISAGGAANTGLIRTAKIGGNIQGGTGNNSGGIYVGDLTKTGAGDDLLDANGHETLGIVNLTVGKSIIAGNGAQTGFVFSQGMMYKVTVGGDLDGTNKGRIDDFHQVGVNSARIAANIDIGNMAVVFDADSIDPSDDVTTDVSLASLVPVIPTVAPGFIKVMGFVKGGNNNDTGEILADVNGDADSTVTRADGTTTFGNIVQLSIGKGIVGGSVWGGQTATNTGYVAGYNVGTKDTTGGAGTDKDALVVGKSGIVSGANNGADATSLANSGAIRSTNDISRLIVLGAVSGNTSGAFESRVVLASGHNFSNGDASAVTGVPAAAVASALVVLGSMSHTDVAAGYAPSITNVMTTDASSTVVDTFGDAYVSGNWNSSNLVADLTTNDGQVAFASTGVLDSNLTPNALLPLDDGNAAAGVIGTVRIGQNVTALVGRCYAIAASAVTGVTEHVSGTAVTVAGAGNTESAQPGGPWNLVTAYGFATAGHAFQDMTDVTATGPDKSAVLLYLVV